MAEAKLFKKLSKRVSRPVRNLKAKDLRAARKEFYKGGNPFERIIRGAFQGKRWKNKKIREMAAERAGKRRAAVKLAGVSGGVGSAVGAAAAGSAVALNRRRKKKKTLKYKAKRTIRRVRRDLKRRRDRLGRFS